MDLYAIGDPRSKIYPLGSVHLYMNILLLSVEKFILQEKHHSSQADKSAQIYLTSALISLGLRELSIFKSSANR